MKKMVLTVCLVMMFVLNAVGTSMAESFECTVEAVDENKVVLVDCGSEAEQLKIGCKVKVKVDKKKKGMEGC